MLFLGLLGFLFCSALHGQNITGSIPGTITDSAAAAVAEAKVTISNEKPGLKREVTSDGQGGYVANFLPVGVYSVAIERPGFRRAAYAGIQLQVDQRVRLDVRLELGQVNQEVTVQVHWRVRWWAVSSWTWAGGMGCC